MTPPKKLSAYDDEEAAVVLSATNDAIVRGYITSARDLFPDIPAIKHTAYARTPLPLSFLLFLYDRTVIYVPPARQEDLEERWGVPLETVVALTRSGIVQPIIGRATDYGAPHFEPLLETRPPALLMRGVSLLNRLGLGDTLLEKKCPLPIARMAEVESLRQKYLTYYPELSGELLTERIKYELLINYADLWIFGEGELADSLRRFDTAHQVAQRLFLANEIRTYPILFGLGGTANYDRDFLASESSIFSGINFNRDKSMMKIVPQSLPLLLTGLGLSVRDLNPDTVTEFHQSGHGERLRKAMGYFESKATKLSKNKATKLTRQEFLDVAADLQRLITEVARELSSPQFVRRAKRVENVVRMTLRVGSPAIGGCLSHLIGASILEGIGGASVLEQLLVEPNKEKVVDTVLAARFNPGLANLWRIRSN